MGRAVVLLCHGFMGSPRQMAWLVPIIERAGLDVVNLTLPGHECDINAFAAAHDDAWQRAVNDAVDDLRARYDSIVLIGHSMGGLLAVLSAVENAERVRAVFALAFPLRFRLTARAVATRVFAPFCKGAEAGETLAKMIEFNGVHGITPFNAIKTLPNTLRLLRVIRRTKQALPRLTVPLTVVLSDRDELVSPSTMRLTRRLCPDASGVRLVRSGHICYTEEDQKAIEEAFASALSAVK